MSKVRPVFDVRETHLCTELKLSLDDLRTRRNVFLVQGVHWDYVKKRVLLSSIGALILRGTRDALTEPSTPKNAPAVDSEAPRPVRGLLPEKGAPRMVFQGELWVWGVPVRNPRLVVAYIPGHDPNNPQNLVSVQVRDNQNFIRGMKVPGPGRGLHQTQETVFELVGACPRWRGKW